MSLSARKKALYSAPGSSASLPASAGDFGGQGSYGDLDVYGSRYARRGDCDSSCESGEETCAETVCFEPPGTSMAVAGSTGFNIDRTTRTRSCGTVAGCGVRDKRALPVVFVPSPSEFAQSTLQGLPSRLAVSRPPKPTSKTRRCTQYADRLLGSFLETPQWCPCSYRRKHSLGRSVHSLKRS
jgi:hypothetical protein